MRAELARYDDHLLRSMGINLYDLCAPSRRGFFTAWLNRSRERQGLAKFS